MQSLIQFEDAVITDLDCPRTTRVPKAVLEIRAPLTAEIAQKIKCGHLYKPNGDPVDSVGKYSPPIKLSDIDFQLPSGTSDEGIDTYRPEMIRAFVVTPKDDLNLSIKFAVHVSGVERVYELLATHFRYIDKPLTCTIRSLQEEFNFSEHSEGTEVDMSGDEREEEEPPLFRQETMTGPHGEVIVTHAVPSEGPAIASATHMGHRKDAKKRTRGEMAAVAEEERGEPAFPVN